ncbi:hypothetical protein MVEN_02000400 [Mycena venus]|uniref:PHD-type domain-containing protein n=1 Tax=Mycena venus TaxID=2733690 RepID=A0A8H6XF01_9AGAR|nr:hypothetical protein MVEN_02000400 [Mycena venus]
MLVRRCSCSSSLQHRFYSPYVYGWGTLPERRLSLPCASNGSPSYVTEGKNEFSKIVEQNPTAGPLKLLVGHPGIDGPGESVAEITPVLFNIERIKYERWKILNGSRRHMGENFVKAFARFEEKHPNFIREAQFGEVSVIVMQTPFMASKLIKSTIDDEAVNGIVSDAAHRVWQERNSLLMVSSMFEPNRLKCWVPGIMSYANGGTSEHYRIHFFHLMDGMADECDSRNITVTDDLFANIGDFSTAQCKGFIFGFVDFWLKRAPNERSVEELLDAAVKLLKGCMQHFRSQVTRVKKISGVVDPSKTDIFENYARELLQCETIEAFNDLASRFINDFPRAERWIQWWMLPAHACMLFPSFRVMNEALWNSIPDTTNAEEAMHWKLYAAIGRFLPIMDGLRALYKFALHYQQLSDAAADGVKVFYGGDRQISGRKIKNDGRLPDTSKALMGTKRQRERAPEYEKSYRWKGNSCWLDSSLTIIAVAAARDYSQSMEPMFTDLPANNLLGDLRQMVYTRLETVELAGYEAGGCTLLSKQRDGFRFSLQGVHGIQAGSRMGFNTMFGWLHCITDYRHYIPDYYQRRRKTQQRLDPAIERTCSYFRMISVKLKSCTGAGQDHWQLPPITLRGDCQLGYTACEKYGGDMRKWFQDLVRVTKSESLAACWQTHEGVPLCDGNASEQEIILNLPVVLIIEMGETKAFHWHIPGVLSPYASNPAASVAGVKYNIVGHIYSSTHAQHFIMRYLSISASRKKIFDYNGRKHEGHAIRRRITTIKGTLTGPSQSIEGVPEAYYIYALVYHLEGGEQAQRFFRKEQLVQAEKLGLIFTLDPASKTGLPLACEFRRPNIVRVADADKFWLVTPSPTILDYISTSHSHSLKKASPRKAIAQASSLPMAQPSPGDDDSNSDMGDLLPHSNIPPPSRDDEIDQMLLDTIASPAERRHKDKAQHSLDFSLPQKITQSATGSRSSSPSPVWCQGCGMQDPDGDDDPDEVQYRQCKLWSHINCLTPDVDWNDPEVEFVCRRCYDPLVDLFRPNQIVLLPSPRVLNWKSADVLWYPAIFIERHESRAGQKNEYEFRWMQCTDGSTYNSATSDLPLMMQRTFFRARKFCQETDEVQLTENQTGKIRMPRYMDPSFKHHENPVLAAIFDAAIPAIAEILEKFDDTHPMVEHFSAYFKPVVVKGGKKRLNPSRDADQWMRSCGLVPTPELDVLLEPALGKLMEHVKLAGLRDAERSKRALGVGSVLLQFLAVQQELDEPLNLNSDLLADILEDRVVPCPYDGDKALEAMFSSVNEGPSSSASADRMLKFKSEHVIWDDDFRPPTYRRDEPSRSTPTAPIPVAVKRKSNKEIEGQPPLKRAKGEVAKKVVRAKAEPKAKSTRKSSIGKKQLATACYSYYGVLQ